MSGDFGPHVILPAVVSFLNRHPNSNIILLGDENIIKPLLPSATDRIRLIHTSAVIAMDEKPSAALRNGRDSSLYQAIEQVASGEAQACVSAGNTGAMMAIGRYRLGTLPGIDRPAIATILPTQQGQCYMLDLGANVDCSPEHLLQFALMGSVLTEATTSIDSPKIGVLNIGKEEIKGNELVKQSAQLIEANPHLNYIGFVEGDDIYGGAADVIVCDGFVGNIALKSSEGLARLVANTLDSTFRSSLYGKLVGWLAKPVLNEVKNVLDPSRRNGASLLGLQGTVIKSHGSADQSSFLHAIEEAYREAVEDIPARVRAKLAGISS